MKQFGLPACLPARNLRLCRLLPLHFATRTTSVSISYCRVTSSNPFSQGSLFFRPPPAVFAAPLGMEEVGVDFSCLHLVRCLIGSLLCSLNVCHNGWYVLSLGIFDIHHVSGEGRTSVFSDRLTGNFHRFYFQHYFKWLESNPEPWEYQVCVHSAYNITVTIKTIN
jgi:hypothetical protein